MIDIWDMLSSTIETRFFLGALVAFVLIYFMSSKKTRHEIKWLIAGLSSSGVIAYISSALLKLIFQVPRICAGQAGCPTDFSFPSEHVSVAFAMAVFLVLYKRDWRWSVVFLGMAVLLLISRLMIGVHTIQDVVVGVALGSFIAYVVHMNRGKILKLNL